MKNDPIETLQRFAAMAALFPSFALDPKASMELSDAIEWVLADRKNHIARCALLRQRPDLPADRVPALRNMERLQRLEQELMSKEHHTEHYGLTPAQVTQWAMDNGGLMSRVEFGALCQLALERMDTYTDERGVTWSRPTAFAYAMACKSLASAKDKIFRDAIDSGQKKIE